MPFAIPSESYFVPGQTIGTENRQLAACEEKGTRMGEEKKAGVRSWMLWAAGHSPSQLELLLPAL